MLFFLLSISRDQLEFCVVKTAPFHSYSDWPVPVDCERNGFNGTGEFPRVRNAGILLFDGRPKMTWDPQSAPPHHPQQRHAAHGRGFHSPRPRGRQRRVRYEWAGGWVDGKYARTHAHARGHRGKESEKNSERFRTDCIARARAVTKPATGRRCVHRLWPVFVVITRTARCLTAVDVVDSERNEKVVVRSKRSRRLRGPGGVRTRKKNT